jgi:glyoxylase-like metal-dependent hydrolase (beta-lactamase superfamily II)
VPPFQVQVLDLRFQGSSEAIAAFLVVGPQGPVLVETGPGSTLQPLIEALARFGYSPADIHDVLVTHIHLDHAGAAGWWSRQGARVHVHHVGAPHLADPSKLLASAERIYGDRMKQLWGDFLDCLPEKLHALHDGDLVEAGGLRFLALDTPGHARHHMVFQLEDVAFAGDLAGIRLSGRKHLRMPTPPPEFSLEEWMASIERLREARFRQLYLTHFGTVSDVEKHWAEVEELLKVGADRIGRAISGHEGREEILSSYTHYEDGRLLADGIDEEGRKLYTSVGPPGMSVDGIMRYWKKKERYS